MCEWRSELDLNYRCGVPAEPGSKYCIFHALGQKDIDKFKERLYEQINEDGRYHAGNQKYNFRGYSFPIGMEVGGSPTVSDRFCLPAVIDQELTLAEAKVPEGTNLRGIEVKGHLECSGAMIRGELHLSFAKINGYAFFQKISVEKTAWVFRSHIEGSVSFDEATIGKDADFSESSIGRSISLTNAKISGDLSCSRADVGRSVTCSGAKILGDATFSSATIGESLHLDEAILGGRVSLHSAIIKEETSFSGATIEGDVILDAARTGRGVSFVDALVKKKISFSGSHIDGSAWFLRTRILGQISFYEATIDGFTSFSHATIDGKAHFHTAIFRRSISFEKATFKDSTLFSSCEAAGLELGEAKPTILFCRRDRTGISLCDIPTRYQFWHFAQRAFANQGKTTAADAAYYFERLSRLSPLRIPLKGKWWHRNNYYNLLLRLLALLFQWLPDCLFLRWPTAYGASLSRLFTTWAVLIGSFTSIYYLLILRGVQLFDVFSPGLEYPFSFGRALYFSIITFTTLGYGDIRPMPGLGSALTATEAVLGGIMMALTVLVISRKFMR